MHCLKCGARWIAGNITPLIESCPVCGIDYKDHLDFRGYDSLLEFFVCILFEEGDEICKNTLQITSLLNDYFPHEISKRKDIESLLNSGLGEALYNYRQNSSLQVNIKSIIENAQVSYSAEEIENAVKYLSGRFPEGASSVDDIHFFLDQTGNLRDDTYRIAALEKAVKISPQAGVLKQLANLLLDQGKNLEAAEVLERAADHEDAEALLKLASLYEKGQTIPRDYNKAAEYLKRLEKQGNSEGLYQLGRLYCLGHGVDKSKEKSVYYFSRAGNAGHVKAFYALYKILYKDSAETAIRYLWQSADLKYIPAMYDLAIHLLYGDDMKKNTDQAVQLLEECAEKNYRDALSKLYYMYMVGYEVPVDKAKANEYKKRMTGENSYDGWND